MAHLGAPERSPSRNQRIIERATHCSHHCFYPHGCHQFQPSGQRKPARHERENKYKMHHLFLASGSNHVFCLFLFSWMVPALNKLYRSGWAFFQAVVWTGTTYSYQGTRSAVRPAALRNVHHVPVGSSSVPDGAMECVLAQTLCARHFLGHFNLFRNGLRTWSGPMKVNFQLWEPMHILFLLKPVGFSVPSNPKSSLI